MCRVTVCMFGGLCSCMKVSINERKPIYLKVLSLFCESELVALLMRRTNRFWQMSLAPIAPLATVPRLRVDWPHSLCRLHVAVHLPLVSK